MKKQRIALLAIFLTSLFAVQANAAKSNFERTKPHATKKINDADSDCDGIPAKSLQKSAACKGKKAVKNSKYKVGGGHITVLKSAANPAQGYNTTRSNRSTKWGGKTKPGAANNKAQDHNATRSNKTSASKLDKPAESCDGRDDDCNS